MGLKLSKPAFKDRVEETLIIRCRRGDLDAFEELIGRYERNVFNIVYRFAGNYEEAKDWSQEAFVRIYKSLKKFRGKSSFHTWLYRVVTNLCLDQLRKKSKLQLQSLDDPMKSEEGELKRDIPDNKGNPQEIVERKELDEYIQEALEELSEEHRTVIILRDIQGLSYNEIAEVINCSLGTVKSRISRARETLREKLEPYVYEKSG